MIVVDASALLAIYLDEHDRHIFVEKLEGAQQAVISPVNYWEAMIKARSLAGEEGAAGMQALIASSEIEIAVMDADLARAAVDAFVQFGMAPAKLNLGDCFAYALAKLLNAPLLYKGNDFAATDIVAA